MINPKTGKARPATQGTAVAPKVNAPRLHVHGDQDLLLYRGTVRVTDSTTHYPFEAKLYDLILAAPPSAFETELVGAQRTPLDHWLESWQLVKIANKELSMDADVSRPAFLRDLPNVAFAPQGDPFMVKWVNTYFDYSRWSRDKALPAGTRILALPSSLE